MAQVQGNKMLSLDGVSGFVTIPSSPDLQNQTGFTLEAWVYLRQPPAKAMTLVNKGDGIDGNTKRSYELSWVQNADWVGPGSSVRFTVFLQNGTYEVVDVPVPLQTWTHIAGSFSSLEKSMKVYSNGELVKTKTNIKASLRQTDLPLRIGRSEPSYTWFANALMDEVRIWSRAKLDSEIRQQMYCRLGDGESGLAACWSFEDGTASDVTGHGHDGKLEGGASVVTDANSGIFRPDCSSAQPAKATAVVVNGFVVGATLTSGGLGYTNTPVVTISGGGGTGATAVATMENGVVTRVTVQNPGSGYTSIPTITIAPPPYPARRATAVSTVVNGFVVDSQITDGGRGYETPPTVLFVGGGGAGASAIATVVGGVVTGITITNPGTGYTSAPLVRIASPPFSPELSVEVSRVRVSLRVVLGRKYQLESTRDLLTWTAAGAPFVAQDETLEQEFNVDQEGRLFRISEVP
jgi:hypothetical protein